VTLRRHIEPIGYALAAVALWPMPLVNRLHAESAAIVALVAWALAGIAAIRAFGEGRSFAGALSGRLAALLVPLVLMTVPDLWAPNCEWPHGLLIFALFPGVTVVLSTAVAWAVTGMRRSTGLHLAVGVAVALLTPVYDVGFHPQLYTYNHVFGGVLGPLYDEEIVWRGGLFAFRGLSLAWAAFAWSVGSGRRGARGAPMVALVSTLVIGGCYLASGRLGINTSERDLARALPVQSMVSGVVLHMDASIRPERRRRMESEAAWRYARLAEGLSMKPDGPVDVWVYPDAETRGRLVGARVTSVTPVWLFTPQVHVLDEQFEDIFPHELVHAFSRSFGMPILNASPAVGLVEGLAVAFEPPDGGPDANEQVAAVMGGETADRLARSLDPFGFWGGRGAVSYTTTGSFVGYLCDAYGAEAVEAAYPWADFEGAFGRSPRELAEGWIAALNRMAWLPVDARRTARTRFAVPSLFERRCPHYVPPAVRHRRESVRAWERRDTVEALRSAQRSFEADPGYPAGIAQLLRMQLRAGDEEAARGLLEGTADSLLTVSAVVAKADIMALDGRFEEAWALYGEVRGAVPVSERELRATLALRRILVWQPDAIRILVLGDLPGDRAARLASLRSESRSADLHGALAMAEALIRDDRDEFADAADLMARTRIGSNRLTRGELGEVGLQRLAWVSEMAERAGDLRMAVAYADSAVAFAGRLGDLVARRTWSDQAGRLRHPPEPVRSP